MCSKNEEFKQLLLTNLHIHLDYLLIENNRKTFRYDYHMKQLMIIIFDIHVKEIKFLLEEQKKVANKLKNIMRVIDHYIFCLGNSFDPNLGKVNMIIRSAIQFLLDEMKMWPTENETLNEHLTIFLISDSLETFDEAITNWQDYPYTIAVDVIFYPEEDYIRPNNVPISHVWWKNK